MYKRGVKKCGDDYMLHILKCFLLWNITPNIFWVKVMRHLVIGNILKDRHLFTYHTKVFFLSVNVLFETIDTLIIEKLSCKTTNYIAKNQIVYFSKRSYKQNMKSFKK